MDTTRRLWLSLAALLIASFGVLLWMGRDMHQQSPPMPTRVVTESGRVVYTRADMEQGRQVWQSIGGQQLGSIWGHGALVAPDWSADWLHRESLAMLELTARRTFGNAYERLPPRDQGTLQADLKAQLRTNTYDASRDEIVISDRRAQALAQVSAHYDSLFSNDPATAALRESYAMRNDTVPDAAHRRALASFFFWTSWAAVTDRPGHAKSYTNNWPYEPLVANTATSGAFMWSMFSVLFMVAGIGLLAWHHAVWHGREAPVVPPVHDPLAGLRITPSMRATAKYFWVVIALFLVQILLGATTAHYQVEGQTAYGYRALRNPSVQPDAKLAHAARRTVDRHRVARHGAVHRAGHLRSRAPLPAPRRERAVDVPHRDRRRRLRGAMVRGDAEARAQVQLLVRASGLGIHRHRALLADLPVHRPAAVARARRARAVARAAGDATTPRRSSVSCSFRPSRSASSTARG